METTKGSANSGCSTEIRTHPVVLKDSQPHGIQEEQAAIPSLDVRRRSRSVGGRQWTRVRAVMAWYTRLHRKRRNQLEVAEPEADAKEKTDNLAVLTEKDKSPSFERRSRSASSQRWLKLRTTVQLTAAMSNSVQTKKTTLKREDSFIARFSTRQIPESQETFDATDEGGSSSGGIGATAAELKAAKERRRRHRKPPRSVLNPDENALFYWMAFLALWVLYNLWTMVVRLTFPELQSGHDGIRSWSICDALGDAAYVLDIIVQFRTGYLEQGIMVHDSRKLAVHYMRSRPFLIDLLALMPIDWLLLPLHKSDAALARWRPSLRCFRLIKLYRVYAFYYVVESRTVYPNAWRVINLVHILLVLAHWFGCFYFLLSESEGFQSDWAYPYPEGDYATLTRKYLASLYWSTLTLTTIGDLPTPETNSERPRRPKMASATTSPAAPTLSAVAATYRHWYTQPIIEPARICANDSRWVAGIGNRFDDGLLALPRRGFKSRILHHTTNQGYIFTIASYLIGVFIFATIVGQVGNVITNRNASRLEFERLLDTAKLYMRHHKVPRSMQRRVQRWYDYAYERGRIQGGGDTSSALRILPDKLKTELALHVNLATLKKVSIFKECQPEFLHDLVLKMRASIFTPGDMICRKGEVAREMFIIADGILEVISSETGKVLTSMKAGDFFGEIGILNLDGLNKRTADVRSVGYAELFSLSREDVLSAMKDYPEAEDILLSLGRKRLVEARKAASHHRAQMARKGLLALERNAQLKAQKEEEQSQSTTSKLTSRIRGSNVFGLGKVLRKSFGDSKRPKSSSPTLIEMGNMDYGGINRLSKAKSVPLVPTTKSVSSSGSRERVLRRMSRVISDETSQSNNYDESQITQPLLQKIESPPEVIGAGLPLFQRLKLLKQRELEKEKQQQLQQEQQQRVTVILEPNAGVKLTTVREDKQIRHISFVEEPLKKSCAETGTDSKSTSKPSKWNLAVLPRVSIPSKRLGTASKLKLLDTIQASSLVESVDQPESTIEVIPEENQPAVKSRLPATQQLSSAKVQEEPYLTKRKHISHRSLTLRNPILNQHEQSSNMHDGFQFRSFLKSKSEGTRTIERNSSVAVNLPQREQRSGVGSFTRQNTIQVVSDVQGVLTDILRDIIPKPNRSSPLLEKHFETTDVRYNYLKDIEDTPKPKRTLSEKRNTVKVVRMYTGESERRGSWSSTNQAADDVSCDFEKSPRPKRLNLKQCKNRSSRDYNSIDDLSPEYTVLPFVKRLKILNERQKIAELKRALTVVKINSADTSESEQQDGEGDIPATSGHDPSSSTDLIPDDQPEEATVKVVVNTDEENVTKPVESNDTPERVNLKKMLKTMSRSDLFLPQEKQNRMKLLRSQTVEGYAVRHANFVKLKSQAGMAHTLPSPPSDFHASDPSWNNHIQVAEQTSVNIVVSSSSLPTNPLPTSDESNMDPFISRHEFTKASMYEGTKGDCVADIFMAIKVVLQDRMQEMQSRFQAEINSLQMEVDKRDEMIAKLQRQLQMVGSIRPDSPIPQSSSSLPSIDYPQDQFQIQTMLSGDGTDNGDVNENDEEENENLNDNDEEYPSNYFARSCSRDSFIHYSPEEKPSPNQINASSSPCPSIDDMLDSAEEEYHRLPTAINPEPLWQLEFGSCWERMEESPITENPNDLVIDMEDSSWDKATGGQYNKKQTSTTKTDESYNPDWEILMLAESLEENHKLSQESSSHSGTRRRGIRTSTSVDPQKSRTRSRKMMDNWSLSFPTPDEDTSRHPENPDGI